MHPAQRLLCIIGLCLRAPGGESSSWTIDVPGSVSALIGSCVVIPCSFDYPTFEHKSSTEFTGIWMDRTEQKVYHPDSTKMVEKFQGRVTLLGSASEKNCSMMINPVQEGDEGPFCFRIEITDYEKYSFKDNEVSVTVKRAPEPITFELHQDLHQPGQVACASCFVVHTCPTAPPTFTWNHSGLSISQLRRPGNGQWQAGSQLCFQLTLDLHNRSLVCRVQHKGGQVSSSSQVLLVKHAPLTVTVEQPRAVPEGQGAELRCRSDGFPPVQRYWWSSEGEELLQVGQTYRLPNVSRHTELLYCGATNTQGTARSRLVRINATYPPEVSQASACSTSTLRVSCECVVEANPPAVVLLSRPGTPPLSTLLETQGSVTVATLAGDEAALWSSDPIYCHAFNRLGNITHTLQVPSNGQVLIFTAVATGVLLLIVMVPLGIIWKRKQIQVNKTLTDTYTNKQIYWNKKNTSSKDGDAVYANM